MQRRALLTAGLFLISGCATPSAISFAPEALGELEALYAVRATRGGVVIEVASNGCTRRDDFTAFVQAKGAGMAIAFARKRLDNCKAFARGRTALTFTYVDLGVRRGQAISVLNPVAAWVGP